MKVFRWGSRALDMFPEDNALHKTYNFEGKVIIIGAGASGLAAAKILQRNNIDYLILEASNRYGGRLKENKTLADFPIDLGAEWIHHLPAVLNSLKGMCLLVPRNMTQAAGFYNTLIKSDDPALIVECVNGYRLK